MIRNTSTVRRIGQWLSLAGVLIVPAARAASVPRLDHVIVVVMENKNYEQVRTAPYITSLVAKGVSFSDYHAITHPSQPNYLALWSGSTQGVSSNQIPPRGAPFTTENLGHLSEAAGLSWRAYSEDLPAVGAPDTRSQVGSYFRKHAPWTEFGNLDHQNERPYTDLATDIAAGTLPNLAFVIPNNNSNTHDQNVLYGDAWLSHNVPAMLEAVGPRGIVVLTWDENDNGSTNRILAVVVGGPVKSGFVDARKVDHFTMLRTICDALRLPAPGMAANAAPISDIWSESADAGSSGTTDTQQ